MERTDVLSLFPICAPVQSTHPRSSNSVPTQEGRREEGRTDALDLEHLARLDGRECGDVGASGVVLVFVFCSGLGPCSSLRFVIEGGGARVRQLTRREDEGREGLLPAVVNALCYNRSARMRTSYG